MSEADNVTPGQPGDIPYEPPHEPMQWTLPGASGPKERRMWAGLLLLLALVAYVPAINSQFIWDDDRHVTANPNLRDSAGLVRIWTKFGMENGGTPQYYPLTHTTFWIEHQLYADNPLGYHLVNVVLHGIAAVLLWEILRRLRVPGAWLAAAVWAVHPLNVESVAWITERKNVLSGALALGAVLAYFESLGLRDDDHEANKPSPVPPIGWWAISFGLFVLALLSKTTVSVMPAVMILILWWKDRLNSQRVIGLIPYFAVGVGLGLLTAGVETRYVGASGPDWDLSFAQRIIIAGRAIWFYARKVFVPIQLTFSYRRWVIDPANLVLWIFPVSAAIVLAAIVASWRKLGRGTVVGVLLFVGALFPALGFFNVYPMRYSFVADHFTYLASIGIIALVIGEIAGKIRSEQVAVISGGALLAVLVAGTWVRANSFYDNVTLWQDTIAKNDSSWMAKNNLGVALTKEAHDAQIKADGAKSVGDNDAATEYSKFAQTNLDQAEKLFKETLDLRPQHESAHYGLGVVYEMQGKPQLAREQFEQQIIVYPDYTPTYFKLGMMDLAKKDLTGAEAMFKKAMELDSVKPKGRSIPVKLAEPRLALGKLYESTTRPADAEKMYREALAIKPDMREPRFRLAMTLEQQNKIEEAIVELKKILLANPSDPQGLVELGFLLGKMGRLGDAQVCFAEALRLDPNNRDAKMGMKLIKDVAAAATRPTTRTTTRPTTGLASTQRALTATSTPVATQPAAQ